ncbi:MAG: hypothetical protein DRN05_03410 [Thermoplasmata archaeon]|nr:MAG: hypothetical protein DRN05_03410 [Thermoplasmata archaeon]
MADKDTDKITERIYVVPLRRSLYKSSKAAPRAMRYLRSFLTKHMKVKDEDVWIDDSLNRLIWSRGKYKIPGKIRIRAVKFEDGIVEATLPEIGLKKSRREILREEREKKTPILKKEEKKEEEETPGEEIPGAEGYEITPTAEGEVKIKKKKKTKAKKKEKTIEEEKKTTEKKSDKTKEKTKTEEKQSKKKNRKTSTKKKIKEKRRKG